MDNKTNNKDAVVKASDYDYMKDFADQANDFQLTLPKLPVLKINYNSASKVAKVGEWVLGQRIETDAQAKTSKIVEEGIKVEKIVILRIRNFYAYFDKNDKNKNCFSPIHKDFEKVEGSNYKNICGKGCPYRNLKDDKCVANRVIYSVAVLPDKTMVDCVIYLKGKSYMPIGDFIKNATVLEAEGNKIPIPVCGFITKLGSKTEQFQSRDYYIATFERGNILGKETVMKFMEKIPVVDKFIEFSNKTNDSFAYSGDEGSEPTNQSTDNSAPVNPTGPPTQQETSTPSQIIVSDDDDDLWN